MNAGQKEILDRYKGYYTLPFSGDGFEGEVIKLDPESFNILYQRFCEHDEHRFRTKLEKMDDWFFDKPYKVYSNWLTHILKWMERENEKTKRPI